MMTAINQYNPDYAVSPGMVLAERLAVQGISHAEFARRCGRSPKLISEIITGKAPLEPLTALQFEKVSGVAAAVWLGIETDYRLNQARRAETEKVASAPAIAWAKTFPWRELVKRGCFARPRSDAECVSGLLAFFGMASVEAWNMRYGPESVAYRRATRFNSDQAALAAWRRLGELEAERQNCTPYNMHAFKQAAVKIRALTCQPVKEALQAAEELCNGAGVALVVTPSLPRTALSGAAWWLSSRKAIIQLTTRYRSDDHLWFTFFHEAAHILLHGKKGVFIDELGGDAGQPALEAEADNWAADMLVPAQAWKQFVTASRFDKTAVRGFAASQGIAPGIVVGRLQHEGRLPWNRLNDLKAGMPEST